MKQNKDYYRKKNRYDFDDLVGIMELLRAPDGCPWDREQTHKSIRKNFIEEVYEAVEAIDDSNTELLREELGDVLMQVVFHCCISEEEGEFNISDVTDELCRKLVVRHPHVFGSNAAADSAEVLVKWEKIKQETKGQKSVEETLLAVPKSLPSLMRAQKMAKRAAKGNYELKSEFSGLDKKDAESILGKRLFELCSSAEAAGIDAEEVLYRACDEFVAQNCKN